MKNASQLTVVQMTEDDRVHWDKWAEEHELETITFYWRAKGGENEMRLKNRTYNQGLKMAKIAGYQEPKWFKPWTWCNGVVTVG